MPKDLKLTKIVMTSVSYMSSPILVCTVLHKFVLFAPDLPGASPFPLFPPFSEVGFGLFILTGLLTPKHYNAGVMLRVKKDPRLETKANSFLHNRLLLNYTLHRTG